MDEQQDFDTGDVTPDEGDSWYFDLPNGAWERQEAKNKQLRQNVKENFETQRLDAAVAARRDPFRGRKEEDADAPRWASAGGTWRLNRAGSSSEPEERPPVPAEPPKVEDEGARWTREADVETAGTEPAGPAEPEMMDDDLFDIPAESAIAATHTAHAYDAAVAADAWEPQEAVAANDNAQPEPATGIRLLPLSRREEHDDDDDAPSVSADGEPASRWDEMFSAPAGESMMEAMRQWTAGTLIPADAPPEELLTPFDWEAPQDAGPVAPVGSLTPMEEELNEWSAAEIAPDAAPGGFVAEFDEWPTELPTEASAPREFPIDAYTASLGPVQAPVAGVTEGAAWDFVPIDAEPADGARSEAISDAPTESEWLPQDAYGASLTVTETSGAPQAEEFLELAATDTEAPAGELKATAWEETWMDTATPSEAPIEEAPVYGAWLDAAVDEEPLWAVAAGSSAPESEALAGSWEFVEAVPVREPETPGGESPWIPAPEADRERATLHSETMSQERDADGTTPEGITPWSLSPREPEQAHEAPPRAEEPQPPPGDDDPWADFLSARESDSTVPFASPATVGTGAPVSWEDSAPLADAEPAGSTGSTTPESAGDTTAEDDPWGAIVAASGYEDGNTGVYLGKREHAASMLAEEDAPAPRDAVGAHQDNDFEEDQDEDTGDTLLTFPSPAPEAERAFAFELPPEEATLFQNEPLRHPAWDDSESNVVLDAFLEKAFSTSEDELPAESAIEATTALEPLLGAAAALVDTTEDPGPQRPSFATVAPWAVSRESADRSLGSLISAETPDRWTPPEDGADDLYRRPEPALVPYEEREEAVPQGGHVRARGKTWVRELVETGLLALLVFLAVRASFQNFKVDGTSMAPTLADGQFLIVNKLVYSEVDVEKISRFIPFIEAGDSAKRHVFHPPERGDIIVLKDPRRPETDLIKRVVGLPGETIEIRDGKVYINGYYLDEPYINHEVWHDNRPPSPIPAGEYFVMGDNRTNSLDSRSGAVGTIPENLIIGKAMLSYWPTEQFGLAPNKTPKLTNEPIAAAAPAREKQAAR